ncbi:MAG: ferredoxin oxidoreductase [Candidatus Nezhaarchaeota archaeon]|nr:ferredoxin oxidoreductase [Candidatus Nezhaarchaeota archaeon]MCX8141461.1 ferredoxin oxidoreductase [Candidatus Nezhaarchaeota archaeon]MDW8049727.1 transketolase C-terminal domain-containing protein [Nitrososphaerota archaeon]
MIRRLALPTNYAVAYAVKSCDVDVIAAYPITPQTAVVEKLSEFVADGELDAEFIAAESEHSALSAVVGASAVGARVFTATSSQGLALMHEVLFIASSMRLPIVMAIANRTLSMPLNIHNDHQDMMASRDCGWVQMYVSSAQEAHDSIIQSYRLAERSDILVPVCVCYDGFVLSHTYEPVIVREKDEVMEYLPRIDRPNILDPDRPITMGIMALPDHTYEFKYQLVDALTKVPKALEEVDKEFEKRFNVSYGLYEEYMMEDAEVLLIAMGAMASTAKVAIDRLRSRGVKVGLFRPRLYRPIPIDSWREAFMKAKVLAVVDRAIGFGGVGGPLFNDIAALFANDRDRPLILNFIAGIGGRDVTVKELIDMINMSFKVIERGYVDKPCIYYGVRGLEV